MTTGPSLHELGELARGNLVPVSRLLARARPLAHQLKLFEFEDWLKREAEGFHGTGPLKFPAHRIVEGRMNYSGHSDDAAALTGRLFPVKIFTDMQSIEDKVAAGGPMGTTGEDTTVWHVPERGEDFDYGARSWITYDVSPLALASIAEFVRARLAHWAERLEACGLGGGIQGPSNAALEAAARVTDDLLPKT